MIRFFIFVLITLTVAAALWLEAAQWISNAIETTNSPKTPHVTKPSPGRALGDYERIRDNEIRAARMRLFHESAAFLERVGHLHGDLVESKANQRGWLRGHLSSQDGLPRFTEPDQVDLYSYWQRLHDSKQRFAQAQERFEIEKLEIQNRFFKAVEGISITSPPRSSDAGHEQLAKTQEAAVQAALGSYSTWNRLNFDNFASFQAVYR